MFESLSERLQKVVSNIKSKGIINEDNISDIVREIRLCLLLHDIGKPFSYTEGEVRNFHGHAEVSKEMSKKILKRLGFDDDFINEVCYLIKNHDTKLTMEEIEKNYELAYKRYLIQYCDAMAHNPEKLEKRKSYLLSIKNSLDK